jgi:glycosyl transferase family 25
MERFKKDFESFPVPFVRVSAIEGKTLTFPIEGYDAFMFFWNEGREASPGEIGCYLSHIKALKMFLESGKEFAIICEDDAMPIPESYEAVKQAIVHSETWDLLRLCGGRIKSSFPYQMLVQGHHLCTSITDMIPATAYVVTRCAAEKLIQKLLPTTDFYDSALFQGRWGIREATVFPNCILRNEHSKLSTIREGSNRKRKLKPWHLVFWSCRLFRLRVRTIRYVLQFFRLLKRHFLRKKKPQV